MKSLRLSLVGLVALLLTSCMVGPNYSRPSVTMTAAYKEGLRPAPTQSRQSPHAGEGLRPAPTQSRQGWKVAQPSDQTPHGNWLANERNAVDILRRRMDASVLLIKAIGGGWHVSDVPPLARAQ